MGRRQPKLPWSHKGNTLVRVVGALNPHTGEVHHALAPAIKVAVLTRFLMSLGKAYPQAKRICVILDNWPVHFHPKVQAALAAEPRIQVIPLPTYAPWLNRIEKLWRWVKQRVTHAHPWCDDFLLFRQQVLTEFQRLALGSPELKRYCGLGHLYG